MSSERTGRSERWQESRLPPVGVSLPAVRCWQRSQRYPLWPALLRPAGRGDLRADGVHLFSLRRTVLPRGFLRVVVGHRGVEALGYQVLTCHFIGIARARYARDVQQSAIGLLVERTNARAVFPLEILCDCRSGRACQQGGGDVATQSH